MFNVGDAVNRIGGESVDGLVLKVTVDMGDDPGTVLEVGVGNSVRKVQAGACGKGVPTWSGGNPLKDVQDAIERVKSQGVEIMHARDVQLPPVEEIHQDGSTMPVAEGADVTAGVN